MARQFSFTVPQYSDGIKTLNKNIALLTCEKWPENTTLFGTISVDLSRPMGPMIEAVSKILTFEGEYYYTILNKKYVEQITGTIPWTDMDVRLEKLFGMNPYNGQIVIDIDAITTKKLLSDTREMHILPHIKAELFEISLWCGKDKKFNALLSNGFSKEIVLQSRPIDKILSPIKNHRIIIQWGDNKNKLYIDCILEDEYKKRH